MTPGLLCGSNWLSGKGDIAVDLTVLALGIGFFATSAALVSLFRVLQQGA